MDIFIFGIMIFYSNGLSRKKKGRGNRPRGVWKHGRNKKIIFLVNFNVDSDKFNHPTTTGHFFLGSLDVPNHRSTYHARHQYPL